MKKIKFACWFVLLGCICQGQDRLYDNMFPVEDVVLLKSPFQHPRDLNIKVLLEYDIDRLLQPLLKEAELPEKGARYANWAGLDGHAGGHYLSALAMNYAATNDTACKRRMDYMIAELKACAEAHTRSHADWGTGYIGVLWIRHLLHV